MDNQVFLPFTFAEIYNKTPKYMHGEDVYKYNSIQIAHIEYGGQSAYITCVFDCETDVHTLVLCDPVGNIL